jgi:antitoxin component YwqK of YwqJK toxin-antitoxin module
LVSSLLTILELSNIEMSMRRVFCLLGYVFLMLCARINAQPARMRTIYTDRNYREVKSIREATYTLNIIEDRDSVYFETWNKTPKALLEKGKYPINQGFDVRNCYVQKFWPNKELRAEGYIKKTWNEGVWSYYDESGKLYSKVEYVDGMMNGRATRYYPDGLLRIFNYEKNIRNGESLLTDTSDKIIEVCYYSNDTLDGLAIEYFETGQLKRKTKYNRGIVRVDTVYWENGVPFSCTKYNQEGNLEGRSIMYTKTKKIARYDEYSNGELTQNDCIHPLADATWDGDDCPPRLIPTSYPGGMNKYLEYVSLNQDFPEPAILWKQQGVIEFEFTVEPDGTITKIRQENLIPLGFGLEKECIRLLDKIKKFEPERLNGRAIPVRFKIPYVFVLQD